MSYIQIMSTTVYNVCKNTSYGHSPAQSMPKRWHWQPTFSEMMEEIILTEKLLTCLSISTSDPLPFHHHHCHYPIPSMQYQLPKTWRQEKAKFGEVEEAFEETFVKKISVWQPMHVTRLCCCKLYALVCVNILKRLLQ